MKIKFYSTIIVFLLSVYAVNSFAQGCVAVRNMNTASNMYDSSQNGSWQFSMNYRYFRSYKHFVGDEEQKERTEQKTNVINHDNSWLLGINYTHNKYWSFSAVIPVLYIDRSSLYEHLGNSSGERYHTQSKGLGDIRVSGYFNALSGKRGRLMVGLGAKLPTGNSNYADYFHKKAADGTTTVLQLLSVDQSIQPGDGGFGITTELDAVVSITHSAFLYAGGVYLFNPRNTNNTLRSSASTAPLNRWSYNSVTDQFFARAGIRYVVRNFQLGIGGRVEGIPSKDAIGKSDGFRRPGYIASVEPSVFYNTGNHTFGLNVPVAVVPNRTRSQNDIEKGWDPKTDKLAHGDAAFADYLISVTYAYRLNKKAVSPFGKSQSAIK